MFKRLYRLFYIIISFQFFFGHSAFAELPEHISIAVFDGADPVAFTDDKGHPAGFFPELLEHIFKENNINIEYYQRISFQEAYTRVLSGEISLLPALKFSKQRAEYFDFNKEAFIVSWSQVFTAPDSSIETVFDLKDRKVALMNNDQNGRNFINLMHGFDIPFYPVFYGNLNEMSNSLLNGNVDAIIAFNFYAKSNHKLRATEIIFSPARALVVTKKGTNKEILDLIDRELIKLKDIDNSIYYRLLDKWLLAESYSVIPSWIYIVLTASAAVTAVTVLFIFLLRIRVKHVKKQLNESEEVYKAFFENANDSIFLMQVRRGEYGAFYDVNKTACDRFGFSRRELLTISPVDITADENKSRIPWVKEQLLTKGHAIFKSLYLTKDQVKVPVEVNAITIDLHGEKFIMSIVRDLSYREEFDNLLSAVEMKYKTIADYNYDWEFWQTPERDFIYSSPSCLRMSGYDVEDFLGDKTLLERIIYEDDSVIWSEYCSSSCLDESTQSSYEFRIRRKDGPVIWVELQSRKIFDTEGKFLGFRGSIRDIEKRKSMEEQLKRKQKLESIGVLAGGIAHDFNNILAIIRGYAELGQIENGLGDDTREKFSTILQAANRGVDLTGQILDFARDRRSEIKPVKVSGIAKEIYTLIKPSFPGSIKINLESESDSCVLADEGQMHQIFMNICTNARLAMPDGGELTLKIRDLNSSEAASVFPDEQEAEAVEICFRDTGIGMNREIKEKIFDPFFTTREAGKGAGMGMSVVHGLIKQWGGQIYVKSIPGEGTSIYLYLKKDYTLSEETAVEEAGAKVKKMSNIIVFDDEEMILDLVEKFLKKEGHSVVAFNDVLKGLEYFKDNYSSFDLVITDMTMPDMSGEMLAEEIKKISFVPVLLSSGYSDRLHEENLPSGIDLMIKKPFTGKELISAVNSLLD